MQPKSFDQQVSVLQLQKNYIRPRSRQCSDGPCQRQIERRLDTETQERPGPQKCAHVGSPSAFASRARSGLKDMAQRIEGRN